VCVNTIIFRTKVSDILMSLRELFWIRTCNTGFSMNACYLFVGGDVSTCGPESTMVFSLTLFNTHFLNIRIIFSLIIQYSFNFIHSNDFFIQHSTSPPFISYSYLILYFCLYNYIKIQLSIIIKLKNA